MNKSEIVFKAIDIFGHPLQNSKRFSGITCVKDIAYGEHKLHKGDLYFKDEFTKNNEKKPVLLYIRGGGFIKGDKSHRVTIGEYYANAGYYVFSVNYRLPPEGTIDVQIQDCCNALNYIETLSEEYNIDLNNIFISGDSSGACHAAFVAAVKYDELLQKRMKAPDIKPAIKGVVLMSGIYDIEALLKKKKLFGVIPQTAEMTLGMKFNKDCSNIKDYELYDCISPDRFINNKWCPVFISWANQDIFCKGQGEEMYRVLTENIDTVKMHIGKGIRYNHCYHLFLWLGKAGTECMNASIEFMNDLLNF